MRMSSSRRNNSVSRAAEAASKSRLHMDRNPQHTRITDPSNPAGRRKEIDNVMKRARRASPGSWDRKLLEVEEKDPNRWRHTGYKQLYLDGSLSPSPSRRSRTPLPRRSRSPAGLGRRSRSPVGLGRRSRSPAGLGRRSRSPVGLGKRSRSPVGLGRRSRSPVWPSRRSRSPVGLGRRSRSPAGLGRRSRSPVGLGKRRSPRRSKSRSKRTPRRTSPNRHGGSTRRSPRGRRTPPLVSGGRPRTPPAPPPVRKEIVARRESPRRVASSTSARPRPAISQRARPPSPPEPRKVSQSPSGSSVSSCSDESCSVCSAKNKRIKGKARSKSASPPRPPPIKRQPPPPKPSKVPTKPLNSGNAAAQPSSLPLRPTRELLKARETSKRSREEKVLEWQRSQLAVGAAGSSPAPPLVPARRIKREGEREKDRERGKAQERGVSPAAIAAALADEDDDESSASSEALPPRLTLSERFGKMAQWSADRSATLENMRITRRDAGLHVRIERSEATGDPLVEDETALPPDVLDPAPIGSYPEELLAVAPGGLPSWDDVRVRYDYYKKRGYLRGLTLGDYVKWEEWWYKYQEWLKRERAYERWADGEVRREGRRRRGGKPRRS